jgi:hypothetical protein
MVTLTGRRLTSAPLPRNSVAARIAWAALALFTTAFAVLEGLNHGLWTAIAALVLFLAPGLTERRGPLGYNWTHRALLPFLVLLAYTVSPLNAAWIFSAGLGWLTRIACERAAGRRLRTHG